jgi:LysR family transcriptional activator of mexEF-oprN operon
VVLSIPQYSTLPALMAGTDLLASLPDYTGIAMAAASSSMFAEPLPFVTPTMELSMVWLSLSDTDPAERWLRGRLEAFMSDRPQPQPPVVDAKVKTVLSQISL